MISQGHKWIREWIEGLGRLSLLTREAITSLFTFKVAWRDLLYQVYFVGVKSQSVVLITGAFTGMVLCTQTYLQFHKVKMDTGTLAVVSVSMCSELGPVLTGLMVAGRVGAAIAAELGTMRVTEQIDAMRAMGTDPIRKLVTPRMIATVIMLPLLTAVADLVGLIGGFVVSSFTLRLGAVAFWTRAINVLDFSDVLQGLVKPIFFGFILATVGCYQGLKVTGGTQGIGRATTQAVVISSVFILITNFFLAKVMLFLAGHVL
jgi:phospholipid/cholesterol/gamma-HCH transport system permease protein